MTFLNSGLVFFKGPVRGIIKQQHKCGFDFFYVITEALLSFITLLTKLDVAETSE